MTSQQIDSLHELKEDLLKRLRPDFIGIVDGFGFPEKYYRSALISGNPYEVPHNLYLELPKTSQRELAESCQTGVSGCRQEYHPIHAQSQSCALIARNNDDITII